MSKDDIADMFSGYWRRQVAERFPDDDRNLKAAAEHDRLEADCKNISDDLIAEYDALCEGHEDLVEQFIECQSEATRQIGFGTSYRSAEDFLESLIMSMEEIVASRASRLNDQNEKTRIARLRRMARRRDLILRKSRIRQWRLDDQGKFMLVDLYRNFAVAGVNFDLNLDDVEDYLREAVAA